MNRTCDIQLKGVHIPTKDWINKTKFGINRLYYIEEGIGWYTENGVNVPFEPGKLYFIPFYASVPTYSDEIHRLKHVYVNFTLSPPIVSKKIFCLDPNSSEKISIAVSTFRTFCQDSMPYYKLKNPLSPKQENELSFLKSLTVFLTESTIDEHQNDIFNDKTIIAALDIIHSSLHQKLTVNDIAAKCFMSTDGFIKKFTRIVGVSPYSYMKKLKITSAKIMITEGSSTGEAATACGYADASSLLHAIANEQKNKNIFESSERKKQT